MTSYVNAFASVATLKWSREYGLKWYICDPCGMFSARGKCADKEMLTAAFKMGMPADSFLNAGAAARQA
jgi:hypothetical protein